MNTTIPQVRRSLLVVDDDEIFRTRLGRALERRGYEVHTSHSGQHALALLGSQPCEMAVLDLRMPGEWGLNVVRSMLQIAPELRVVVLTAYGSIASAFEAMKLGAVGFLQKPASVDEILRAFELPSTIEALTVPIPDREAQPRDEMFPPREVPSLARAEWEHINRVLTECSGNIRMAARLLGIHRRTLQRKLAKFPARS